MVAAAALAMLLPSVLVVPQTGPSTLAEFAPVPGQSRGLSDTRSAGSASSAELGFGSGAGAGPSEALEDLKNPAQKRPRLKRCVGNPPRQTEDLMSPPCVAYFEGDNGGAITRGVTRDEITVVVNWDCCGYDVTGDGTEENPGNGAICDVDKPPNTGGSGCYVGGTNRDHRFVRVIRALSSYFNDRYQTYGRRVHYYVYWGGGNGRSMAEDIQLKLKPFAIVTSSQPLIEEAAARGIMAFMNIPYLRAASFRRHEPMIWGFSPDIERWEQMYVGYVCNKVAPFPVSHATGGVDSKGREMNGQPRRYALMYTTHNSFPGLHYFAQLAREDLKRCGVNAVAEVTFPRNGSYSSCPDGCNGYAIRNVAEMQEKDVNTVLVLGGFDYETGHVADGRKFYPEIVHAGDNAIDRNARPPWQQNPNWFRNARATSNLIREDSIQGSHPYQACREVDPTLTHDACSQFARSFYRQHFMLFKSIQAAGPRLSPERVDRGLHAIPPLSSSSPYEASCYFEVADYTCVKDAMEVWWDGTKQAADGLTGCWRMVQEGRRYRANLWPRQNEAFINNADPCNNA